MQCCAHQIQSLKAMQTTLRSTLDCPCKPNQGYGCSSAVTLYCNSRPDIDTSCRPFACMSDQKYDCFDNYSVCRLLSIQGNLPPVSTIAAHGGSSSLSMAYHTMFTSSSMSCSASEWPSHHSKHLCARYHEDWLPNVLQ